MPVDNKVIVRQLYEEVWNKRKVELMHLLISPSHALHGPSLDLSRSSMGPEAYKHQVEVFTTGFPDLRFTIEDMIAEKEKVVTYWMMSGTHRGEFKKIPATNKKMSVDGITIHHITKGKIMDSYFSWDMWGMMEQLGVAPRIGQPHSASAR
jgi:steroid delta-isomerase-like uncharacterized protein